MVQATSGGKATSRKRSTTKASAAKTGKTKAAANSATARRSAAKAPAAKGRSRKPAIKLPNRHWLKNYPDGIAHDIGDLAFDSIGALMVDACKRYADRPAFTCMGKTLSFSDIDALSAKFGAFLQAKGLQKGARVAIMMPNVLQYPIAMMGILRAGYTVVNVNPLYTARELEHQLKDSGAEAIVILENFATTLQAVISKTDVKHVVVASMGDLMGLKGAIVNFVVRRVKKMVPAWSLPGHMRFNDALSAGSTVALKQVDVGPDDVAFLQYTGGTTGVAKGAMLTHRNVLSNVAQHAALATGRLYAEGRACPPARKSIVTALPLYHVFALTANCAGVHGAGRREPADHQPARHAFGFVKELEASIGFTCACTGVNTLFNGAAQHRGASADLDFSNLSQADPGRWHGRAARRWRRSWKEADRLQHLVEAYGLTETSPGAPASTPWTCHRVYNGCDRPAHFRPPTLRHPAARTATGPAGRTRSASCA